MNIMNIMDIIPQIIPVLSASAMAVFLISLANYVLSGIAYTRLALRRQFTGGWLAWIPVAKAWAVGAAADHYDERNSIKRKFRIITLIFSVINIALVIAMASYIYMFLPAIEKYGLDVFFYDIGNMRALLPFAAEAIGLLISISIYKCCMVVSEYKYFESTVPEKALLYAIISTAFPFVKGLLLFLVRDKGYDYFTPLPGEENAGEKEIMAEAKEEPLYSVEVETVNFNNTEE